MLIDLIAGARPNFMKIAPITHAIQKIQSENRNISQESLSLIRFRLIHTGQHYDQNMSGSFFKQLNIPKPDVNLEAGGGSQAEQTAAIMTRYEQLLIESGKPDLTVVVGDVTSTMACAITAKKMGVRVAHVEGGIRSRDWTMPEEINRVVTDSITDFFFTTSEEAGNNLRAEGVTDDRVFFVGNTMIDTLYAQLDSLKMPDIWGDIGLTEGRFLVMTLHRPANVDEEQKLRSLIGNIVDGAAGDPVIFPIHPRTRTILSRLGLVWPNLHYIDPLGYQEFIYLVSRARGVITDSGGVTEEATVLGIPCLTLRNNTERPETVTIGTNELIGTELDAIKSALQKLMSGSWKKGGIPDKWDGKTSDRIIKILLELKKYRRLNPPVVFHDERLLMKHS